MKSDSMTNNNKVDDDEHIDKNISAFPLIRKRIIEALNKGDNEPIECPICNAATSRYGLAPNKHIHFHCSSCDTLIRQ